MSTLSLFCMPSTQCVAMALATRLRRRNRQFERDTRRQICLRPHFHTCRTTCLPGTAPFVPCRAVVRSAPRCRKSNARQNYTAQAARCCFQRVFVWHRNDAQLRWSCSIRQLVASALLRLGRLYRRLRSTRSLLLYQGRRHGRTPDQPPRILQLACSDRSARD